MASITRTAKSGNDWTANDLSAYNIRVERQDAPSFFGMSRLPDPIVTPEEVLKVAEANQTTTDDGYVLLRMLNLAMAISPNEESAVADFAVALLRACGYIGRGTGRVARTRTEFPFLICGEDKHAKTDVCILDEDGGILLLVQEDKSHLNNINVNSDPESQLIAETIAAFSLNNQSGERQSESKVMAGITLKGTSPTFYKIPVSTDLVTAVQRGVYPQQETVVYTHVPAVPRPARRYTEGMKPLDNRRIILSCFEAFKQLVK